MLNRDETHAVCAAWQGKTVGVWGDLMLDRYIWGQATRISQEAPIPVVQVQRSTATPGGAANVLNNLAGLGAKPVALGIVGEDDAGTTLTRALADAAIDTRHVIATSARCTTEKTRVVAGGQQIVRVDHEDCSSLPEDVRTALRDAIIAALNTGALDALIIEDYAKGCVDGDLAREIVAHARCAGCPVALDPHPGNRFFCPGLTVMTPNRAEAFAMAGHFPGDPVRPVAEDAALITVAETLLETWQPEHLLITLGGDGMALFSPNEPVQHIPTRAQEVFDVSGAGDTVIATMTLALLGNAAPRAAAEIANHAAGIVVGKVGTIPVNRCDLLESFREA